MKKTLFTLFLFKILWGLSTACQALTEAEAEDLADLTAVFVYLKNDCGYKELLNADIKQAIIVFAQQNHWDLRNYGHYDMKALGENSYHDLRGIAIPTTVKCQSLARDSFLLLARNN